MVKKGKNGTYFVESEVYSYHKGKVIKKIKRGFLTYIDAKNYDDSINMGMFRDGIPMKRLNESYIVYKTPYLKVQSVYNLKSKLLLIFKDNLNTPFNEMNIQVMDNILYEMVKNGRSNSYVNKAINLFKQISKFANERWEGKNTTYEKLKLLPEETSQRKVITLEEFNDNIDKVPDYKYRLCLKTLHGSMCRLGEILALQKKDIKLSGLDIKKSRGLFGEITTTKTKSSVRVANISNKLYNELIEYFKESNEEDFIFEKINRKTLLKNCQKYLGCPIHDLRASMATTLLEKGASLNDISSQLGHCNINTTLHYLRITKNSSRNITNLLNRIEEE